jgi:hypothetical protein
VALQTFERNFGGGVEAQPHHVAQARVGRAVLQANLQRLFDRQVIAWIGAGLGAEALDGDLSGGLRHCSLLVAAG